MFTMADWQEVVYYLSIEWCHIQCLPWPLTQISEARHYSTLNASETNKRYYRRLKESDETVPSPVTLIDLQGRFSDFVW